MLVFMHIAEKDNASLGNRVVIFGLISDFVLFSLEHEECKWCIPNYFRSYW